MTFTSRLRKILSKSRACNVPMPNRSLCSRQIPPAPRTGVKRTGVKIVRTTALNPDDRLRGRTPCPRSLSEPIECAGPPAYRSMPVPPPGITLGIT